MSQNLSSAAVVIGALRVKYMYITIKNHHITIILHAGQFFMLLLSADFFFKNNFFKKFFQNHNRSVNVLNPNEDRLSVIARIRVQTVCKGYQQMTKVTTSKASVNPLLHNNAFEISCQSKCSIFHNIFKSFQN